MRKIIVVAKSLNNVIGNNNDLVWSLAADLQHYHQLVNGGWVLMGRQTFETDYGVLPIKKNIVVTRQTNYHSDEAKIVNSIQAGINWAKAQGQKQLFILGGGQIYSQAIAVADEIVATEVQGIFEGDTFFPEISLKEWKVIEKRRHLADANNSHTFDIVFYHRKKM